MDSPPRSASRYTFSDVLYAARYHRNFNYAFWMDVRFNISSHVLINFF